MRQAELVILIVVSVIAGYGCKKRQPWANSNKQYKIAFTSRRDGNAEIYVMNADGSGLKNLTNNPAPDYDACWSPDGQRIVFVSDRDGNGEVYVMNADGSGQKNLTNNPAFDGLPSWQPVPHPQTKGQ